MQIQTDMGLAEVEVKNDVAWFRWKDGTTEALFNPDRDWKLFGLSEEGREEIKRLLAQDQKAEDSLLYKVDQWNVGNIDYL